MLDKNENKKYGTFIYAIDINTNEKIDEDDIKDTKCVIYFNANNIKNANYFTFNDINIDYDNFPWISYLDINTDVAKNGNYTKEHAWFHWTYHGKKEERAFSYINNSNIHCGRLGNSFFINMFLHFISIKYDLKCNYKNEHIFNNIGIYFNKGNKIYEKNIVVTEENYLYLLTHDLEPSNIIITNDIWLQSKQFCIIIDIKKIMIYLFI